MFIRGSALLFVVAACASAPAPLSSEAARNTKTPTELVKAHLRAIEAGDWKTAEGQLDPAFGMQMKGMPFFVKIPFANALDMHKARKQAFPDFTFNEKIDAAEGNSVRIAVFLKGTHTGYLDYPIKEVPKLEATGKAIDLPAEYFTYFVEGDRIRRVFGEIPEGHGPVALKQQLGVQ
jgi:predicted ester cyclase